MTETNLTTVNILKCQAMTELKQATEKHMEMPCYDWSEQGTVKTCWNAMQWQKTPTNAKLWYVPELDK